MKKFKFILTSMIISLLFLNTPTFAGERGYDLSAPNIYEFSYPTVLFEEGQPNEQLAQGICYGPFYRLKKQESAVANIVSACAFAGSTTEGNTKGTANYGFELVKLFDLFHYSIAFNEHGQTLHGYGIDVIKLWNLIPNRPDVDLGPFN